MKIELKAIATVNNSRKDVIDDNWGPIISEIILSDEIPEEALDGIKAFSHLEIIFYMEKVSEDKAVAQARHPRNDINLPKLGTYAQRNKNRPNKLGLTTVELLERNGKTLKVKYLDAIDGTPILDIKPVMEQFGPKSEVKQANWTYEILKNYW